MSRAVVRLITTLAQMKLGISLLIVVCLTSARANVLVGPDPPLRLVGETVVAKVSSGNVDVSGVFEFVDWSARENIYFPIFADAKDDVVKCLDDAKLTVRIGDEILSDIMPCDWPPGIWKGSNMPKVFWFKIGSDDAKAMELLKTNGAIRITVEYTQKLLNQNFYYLPLIPRRKDEVPVGRAWRYQLIVRGAKRVPSVNTGDIDFERFGDGLVVYLKNQQLVVIK